MNVENLKLTVLSPDRRLVNELDVTEVFATGSEGQIEILPGHAAMIGTLHSGMFSYRRLDDQSIHTGVISTGFFEVSGSQIRLLGETIEMKDEIDVARAKAAQKRAEEALGSPELDEHSFRKYQLKLQRALIRQQIAG